MRCQLSLLALLLAVGPAAADQPESLRDYAKRSTSRHAVGLYVQGKKIGWMTNATKLATRDGKEVAIETTEMLIKMVSDGEATELGQKGETVYALTGDGEILSAEERTTQDKQDTVHKIVRTPKGLTITTTVGSRTQTREVPMPKETLGQTRRLEQWLTAGPAVGAKFSHFGTDWDAADVNVTDVMTYQGKKKVVWGGVPTDVYIVKIASKGAIFDAEILSNGDPLRGKIGPLIEVRAETEEVAKKLEAANIDMMAASSIKVDRDVGNAKQISALKMEVIGLGDFKLPQSHRQRVSLENGKAVLELKRDFREAKSAPLSDADRKRFTSSTPTVQSDQEPIKQLATKLVGAETDPLKKADLLKSWVYKTLRKTMACNATTALAVLDNKAGDCTEHTLLFVALVRAAGVPARELTGVAYVSPIFGWHAWAEVHDGHQWVSVDPTWNELYVDATHIVFAHDTDDHAWLNVLGVLRFKYIDRTVDE